MKKVIRILAIAFLLTLNGSIIQAQPPVPNLADNAKSQARIDVMKLRMKADLNLSDAKADSVCAIQHEFEEQQKQIRLDQTLSPEEKKIKTKALTDKRSSRWRATKLTEVELKRVTDFYTNIEMAEMKR